jgi:hypothetical protein
MTNQTAFSGLLAVEGDHALLSAGRAPFPLGAMGARFRRGLEVRQRIGGFLKCVDTDVGISLRDGRAFVSYQCLHNCVRDAGVRRLIWRGSNGSASHRREAEHFGLLWLILQFRVFSQIEQKVPSQAASSFYA